MAEATRQGEIAPQVKLVKRIVPCEDSSPAEEPLFINYAQLAHAGGCAYIDVGAYLSTTFWRKEQKPRFWS